MHLIVWTLNKLRLVWQDMCQVGQQCLGQKHNDIIAKQRGVITQLKQRICDLEAAKPPGLRIPRSHSS